MQPGIEFQLPADVVSPAHIRLPEYATAFSLYELSGTWQAFVLAVELIKRWSKNSPTPRLLPPLSLRVNDEVADTRISR